jgi:hypothetical protein
VAHLSVARLVFNRTIQPDRKHRLWDRMPSNLAHARWDAGEASPLLGHLVSAGELYGEHGYIKCLGGRKDDDQLQYLLHS